MEVRRRNARGDGREGADASRAAVRVRGLGGDIGSHLILRAVHGRGLGRALAHLAQVHPLVLPGELVRLVNLDVARLAQVGVIVVAEHHSLRAVAQRALHHRAQPRARVERPAPRGSRRDPGEELLRDVRFQAPAESVRLGNSAFEIRAPVYAVRSPVDPRRTRSTTAVPPDTPPLAGRAWMTPRATSPRARRAMNPRSAVVTFVQSAHGKAGFRLVCRCG